MSGSSRTAAVVVLCLAVLASQATASLSDFNLFHHQRASLRKLKASTESKTVLYDLDVVDRCTFKQDFSSGKLGSCIPNQLYVLAKANATADYGEADRWGPEMMREMEIYQPFLDLSGCPGIQLRARSHANSSQAAASPLQPGSTVCTC